MAHEINADVVVLGGGPGGYSAAFRAADLGKQVILVERRARLGGVCLNVGCIPSKVLLHSAELIYEITAMRDHGICCDALNINIDKLREWKDGVINKLTTDLAGLAKRRKVEIIHGVGKFISPNQLAVSGKEEIVINFSQIIIAAGSSPVILPFMPDDDRVINSVGALKLSSVPQEMLIIGGGIIGLEMAAVYDALGSNISVVEFMGQLMPGTDLDLIKPLHKIISNRYKTIMLGTKVTAVEAKEDGLWTTFEGKNAPTEPQRYDCILVAVGRRPNGKVIGAEHAGVVVEESGFITVDKKMCTNVPHIFAVGDIVGNPMLAHKAVAEGHLAAEVIAGENKDGSSKCIPSVAYTDPEIAWVGMTENEAKENGVNYAKGAFPWLASGRSLSLGRDEGVTKLLFDVETKQLLGAGIVGPNAGELISELSLAIGMGCNAHDIAKTIHPHPTLSETVMMAAEAFEGTITDLYMPKRRR